MKLESAAVNAGEEIPAQPGNQNRQRAETDGEEGNQKSAPVMEAKSPTRRDSSCESLSKASSKRF